MRSVLATTLADTTFAPDLPINEPGQFYMLNLYANNSSNQRIGKLMVPYDNGHGWDYRFRIVALQTSTSAATLTERLLYNGTPLSQFTQETPQIFSL